MGDQVGFASLPNQIHKRATEQGFEFNLMVVGESGLGKSTFINTLFLSDLYVDSEYGKPGERIPQTTSVQRSIFNLEENGVALRLSLIDTPGYGSCINNENCWKPVIGDVNSAFEAYMDDESRINRSRVVDNRVHCCLYFISPTCRGLKALDVEFMKKLHKHVNIIPVLAKADTMTEEECSTMKSLVMKDIEANGIEIFQFNPADDDDDDEVDPQDSLPFAVCSSRTSIDVNGKSVLGRSYPWGQVEVENTAHSDFQKLRALVIRTHLQELIDRTHNVLYERYRSEKLGDMLPQSSSTASSKDGTLLQQFEAQKLKHKKKMERMQQEMTQVFEMKVREKEKKLQDSEKLLNEKHEEMRRHIEAQRRELESKRRAFEDEKASISSQTSQPSIKKKSNRLF